MAALAVRTEATDQRALEEFLNLLRARGGSPHTIDAYDHDLRHFLARAGSFADADVRRIIAFVAACNTAGEHPATVARRLAALRSFFTYQMRTRRREDNPARLVRGPRKPSMLPRYLRAKQVDVLLEETLSSDLDRPPAH